MPSNRQFGPFQAVVRMLSEDIKSVDRIAAFVDGVKNKKRKLSGFGHRIYRNYDPRAKLVQKTAYTVFEILGTEPLVEVAVALEQAALADNYFKDRKLYANVDFYSGLIYRAMGFPTDFFPGWFWREHIPTCLTFRQPTSSFRHATYGRLARALGRRNGRCGCPDLAPAAAICRILKAGYDSDRGEERSGACRAQGQALSRIGHFFGHLKLLVIVKNRISFRNWSIG
jgi:hypothetical protein